MVHKQTLSKIETHIVPAIENEARLSDYTPGIFQTISTHEKG